MINSRYGYAVFWSIALVGIVPAIVSTTLLPFNWHGDLPSTSIDSFYLSTMARWIYALLAAVALWFVLRSRRFFLAVAVLPLVILAIVPQDQINLDRRLLASRETLTAYAENYVKSPEYLRRLAVPFDPNSITQNIEASLTVPLIAEWFAVADGAIQYKLEWNESAKEALKLAVETKPNTIDSPAPSADALAAAIAHQELLFQLELESETGNTSVNPDLEVSPNRNGRKINRKPTAKQFNDAKANIARLKTIVDTEKAAQKSTEELRVNSIVASTKDNAFGRIHALQAASTQLGTWSKSLIYSVFCFITLMIFVSTFSFRAIPTATAVLLAGLALAKLGAVPFERTSLTDLWLFVPKSFPVILFVICAMAMRLVALTIVQNIPILQQIGLRDVLRHGLRAGLIWVIPFGALIYVGSLFSSYFNEYAVDKIYSIELASADGNVPDTATIVSTLEKNYLIIKGNPPNIEKDVDQSINLRFGQLEEKFSANLGAWSANADSGVNWLSSGMLGTFNENVPPSLGCDPGVLPETKKCVSPEYYGGYSCGFFAFSCRAKRMAIRLANSTYSTTRSSVYGKLTKSLDKVEKDYVEKREEGTQLAKSQLSTAFATIKEQTKQGVWGFFRTLDLSRLISSFLFMIAIVKSALFVFSRFAFHTDSGTPIPTLGLEGDVDPAEMKLILPKTSTLGHFAFEKEGSYFVRKGRDVDNANKRWVLPPQPLSATFSRVFSGDGLSKGRFNGRYFLRRFEVSKGNLEKRAFTSTNGREFVIWELAEKQQLFFHFRDFEAMSSTLKIRSEVSLRLTTMFFGRMFFSSVVGPGTIILLAHGKPVISIKAEDKKSFEPARLLAWLSTARFAISSHLGPMDVYLSSFQLLPADGRQVVYDADTGSGGGTGAIRFLPAFLLPI